MGAACCGGDAGLPHDPNVISNSHYIIERVVGQGGFGKVNAARKKDTNEWFAIKRLEKSEVVRTNSAQMIMNERNLLVLVDSPYCINAHVAYQDPQACYLVMDLVLGGDLRYHLKQQGKFSIEQTRFFVANTVLALEYLHSIRILHRDIKPDNIVLDSEGYPKLTDLGISFLCGDEMVCTSRSGTKSYMAPEMFSASHEHGPASDYFMLGVVMWECIFGKRPFKDSAKSFARHSQQGGPDPPENSPSLPSGASAVPAECIAFMRGLLDYRPWARLGANGADEIKQHPFYADFDWGAVETRTMVPTLVPDTTKANCDTGGNDLIDMFDADEGKKAAALSEEQQALFKDYDYNTHVGRTAPAQVQPAS